MRGFHTAALVALVALTLCAGGAADNNTPLTRGASNIGTAPATPSLNITATTSPRAQEAQEPKAGSFVAPLPAGPNPTPVGADRPNARGNRYKNKRKPYKHDKPDKPDKPDMPHNPKPQSPCSDDYMDEPMPCTSDSECLEAFPCKNAECVPAKKEKKHKKEKYKWWRSNDDDEKDHPEEYERHQSSDICVCTGDKFGPCTPATDFPNDCSSIRIDIGICKDGICTAEPRDNGCPCGADLASCISQAADEQCLYPDQMCKCDGESVCVPNLLPDSTPCIDTELSLGDCEIALCTSGTCMSVPAESGSACYQGDDPDCLNAGICNTVDGTTSCDLLQCVECASGVICPSDGCCVGMNQYCDNDACKACPSGKICKLLNGDLECCDVDTDICAGPTNGCEAETICGKNADCTTGSFCCRNVGVPTGKCVADIGDGCFFGNGICCVDDSDFDHPDGFLQCSNKAVTPQCPCQDYKGCAQDDTCCRNEAGDPVCTPIDDCTNGEVCGACSNGLLAFCGANAGPPPKLLCQASCSTCPAGTSPGTNCPSITPITECAKKYDGSNSCRGGPGSCQACDCTD